MHPRFLFGALEPAVYASYRIANKARAQQAYKAMSEMMTKNALVKIKESPPYIPELEAAVLMNPLARATLDPKTAAYSFPKGMTTQLSPSNANADLISKFIAKIDAVGLGVDQGNQEQAIRRIELI